MRRSGPVLVLTVMIAVAAGGCDGPAQPAPTASAGHQRPARPRIARPRTARPRTAPARHGQRVSYYLALGDSLARGVQPDSSGASVETGQGYPDQLYAALRRRQPGLRLVKLGCPGETTATMIGGGICSYPGGSQLAAAVRFLRAHRAQVPLITLDIGANDVGSCISQPSPGHLAACAGTAIWRAAKNLATICARLHRADARARIIAMNYYLPALAEWRNGPGGRLLARAAELATAGYNTLLESVYRGFGVGVADVFGAFHTADFGPAGPGSRGPLPPNVADVCRWTWECAPPPRGPNEHPDRAGYRVIADAFLRAYRRGLTRGGRG